MADYDKLIDLDRLSAFKTKADAEYLGKDETAALSAGILFGRCNSTSTATAFTATVEGLDALYDGAAVMLRNGVVTSASGFTINVNGLGAKPVYNNMATGNEATPTAPTRDTTIFNINYTMLLVYDSELVDGGAWICYRGYDGNTNTIGYQLRTNSGNRPMADATYRYRLYFTSADGAKWVPMNTSTSTDATTARTLNTRAIDPFGPIVYNSTNGTTNSGSRPALATLWQQYALTIGYSYVKSLTAWDSVWLKCQPKADGSAVMKDLVQALPSSKDGYIYILLGFAYSATAMELRSEHPVYWHDGTGIRLWTGAEPGSGVDPATAAPSMDGTAAVGTSAKYAREDHVHPTDTSRANANAIETAKISNSAVSQWGLGGQNVLTAIEGAYSLANNKQAKLVSGTNIKTVNSESLLGSGDISLPTSSDIPTKTSDLTNDSGFITDAGVTSFNGSTGAVTYTAPVTSVNGSTGAVTGLATTTQVNAKQDALVSGTNIKTINSTSLLGSGDISTPNDIMAWYGTCSTAATANIKVVVCDSFVLKKGVLLLVRFSAANTYSGTADIMLNVNSTGNKAIYLGQTPGNSTNLNWASATDILFMYNGTNWVYISSMAGPSTPLLEGAGVYYGSCPTAANTAAKLSGGLQWGKKTNGIMIVRFTYGNTVTSQKLTLNVNSVGAADIYVNSTVTSSSNTLLWNDNDVLFFRWSGSYWDYIGGSTAGFATTAQVNAKQDVLVSSTNIKTINSTSLLGSGNVAVQPTLVSGTNIKTVNGNSLLGSGDITISSGVSYYTQAVSIPTSAWSGTTATVNVSVATATNDIIVAPAPAFIEAWVLSGVYCSAQGNGTLTFTCSRLPARNITANVMAFEGGTEVVPYSINNAAPSYFSVNKSEALEGEVVTVTRIGSKSNVYIVNDTTQVALPKAIKTSGGTTTFNMPASSVTIRDTAS